GIQYRKVVPLDRIFGWKMGGLLINALGGDRMIRATVDQQAGFIPFGAGRLGDPVGWKFVLEFGGEH
ncbi:MAG: hypothetical protein VXX28_09535, partial [Verrucomicrobiota bacterium]|nr:hypothetical protein [Verrucomicrobiota bacterium]